MKRFLAFLLAFLLLLSPAVLAHSGRTDANGGHYDRSTGEYHYHHGYPALQSSIFYGVILMHISWVVKLFCIF